MLKLGAKKSLPGGYSHVSYLVQATAKLFPVYIPVIQCVLSGLNLFLIRCLTGNRW